MADDVSTSVLVLWGLPNEGTGEALRAALDGEGIDAPRLFEAGWVEPDEYLNLLTQADWVLVLWDPRVKGSSTLREYARLAAAEGKLISAFTTRPTDVPDIAPLHPKVDLIGWDGTRSAQVIRDLATQLRQGRGPIVGGSDFDHNLLVEVGHRKPPQFGVLVTPNWIVTGPVPEQRTTITMTNRLTPDVARSVQRSGATLLRRISPRLGQPTVDPVEPALGSCTVIGGSSLDDLLVVQCSITRIGPEQMTLEPMAGFERIPIGAPVQQRGAVVGVVVEIGPGTFKAVIGPAIAQMLARAGVGPPGLISVLLEDAKAVAAPGVVTPAALLVATLLWAFEARNDDVAEEMLAFLTADIGDRLNLAAEVLASEPSLTPPNWMAPDWPEERARLIAQAVSTDGGLAIRHLLAASLVSGPLPPPVLSIMNTTQSDLRQILGLVLARSNPEETSWDRVLESDWLEMGPIQAPGGYGRPPEMGSEDPIRPKAFATGFASDLVSLDGGRLTDQLGVDEYVQMLTTLLAGADTPMPVSVGVFGEWGTGKSYFMGLLEQAIDAAAAAEREAMAKNPSRRPARCEHVRQIRFNAWNYADSNLWASLGAHVFDQLARPQRSDEDAALRREDLVAHVSVFQEEKAGLVASVAETGRAVAAARAALDAAEARAKQVDTNWTLLDAAKTVLDEARANPEVDAGLAELKKQATRVGLPPAVAQDPRSVVQALSSLKDRVAALLGWATRYRAKCGALVIGLVVVAGLAFWAGAIVSWALAALMAVAPIIGAAALALRSVDRVLRSAERVRDRLDQQALIRIDVEQSARRVELQAALEAEGAAQARFDEATLRASEAQAELAALGSAEQLARFIGTRSAADDYHGQLGIISVIRRDFDELNRLLQGRRDDPSVEGARIDRIVLYIDDLDRCSPTRVVEVLEAAHLLLALDLFVVVVAVDPRWLVQSLEVRREALDPHAAGRSISPSMSLDYLEKVFQIPFALPPMQPAGLRSMLEGLLRQDGSQELSPPPTDRALEWPTDDPREPLSDGDLESSYEPERDPPSEREPGVESGSLDGGSAAADYAAPDLAPELLDLTAPEIAFLGELASLIRTPRAAKRIANVYRLLRSSQDILAEEFLGSAGRPGEYQVVMELLAIVSAYPELYARIWMTVGPDDAGLDESWAHFLAGFEPTQGPSGTWVSERLGQLDTQVDGWRELCGELTTLAGRVRIDRSVRPYARWAPRVARFSFLPPLLERRGP